MSDQPSYEVYDYSPEIFKSLLVRKACSTESVIFAKQHVEYFVGYFKFLGVQTIVVENRYVDHDFLEDYANYYVKCFRTIQSKCCRLHFFSNWFSKDSFEKLILSQRDKLLTLSKLRKSYQGFAVIKPLPKTIFGRTCLIQYISEAEDHIRHFPIARAYDVNLFGIGLKVSTLAFQEQDKAAAACATSALWSAFQGTGKLFQHSIPSPIEITRAATKNVPIESRSIPSEGLNAQQMAQAIRDIGLEPLSIIINDKRVSNKLSWLKANACAYIKGKVPVIFTFSIIDTTVTPNKSFGKHAVAIGGYGIKDSQPIQFNNSGFSLKAMRLDRFYVHDDQIGPFAKMVDDGKKVTITGKNIPVDLDSLWSSWRGEHGNGEIGSGRAFPEFLLIPLYHKIRIPFYVIVDRISFFNRLLLGLFPHDCKDATFLDIKNLEWDIYLSTINDFKSNFFENRCNTSKKERLAILAKRMPRYIWVCKSELQGKPYLDLLFDATGIEQGRLLLRPIEHNKGFSEYIRLVVNDDNFAKNIPQCDILDWFKKHKDH